MLLGIAEKPLGVLGVISASRISKEVYMSVLLSQLHCIEVVNNAASTVL